MYAYTSGSPGTFGCETQSQLSGFGCPGVMQRNGMLGLGTYIQMGKPLSYAPRFSGLGADAAPAPAAPAASGGWTDVLTATIGGLASIFALSTQQKMAKEAQHAAERQAADQAALYKTQQMYLQGSVTPAPGMMVSVPGGGGGGWGTTVMVVGGLAVAGGVVWALTRRRRR